MDRIIMWIMACGALIGGLDCILGNRFGLGKKFEDGFHLLGPTALSMAGILCLVPLLARLLKKIAQNFGAAFGQCIGIGTNQHAAEKLQIGLGFVIELAYSAFYFHNGYFIFFHSFFDLHFQFSHGGVTNIACNIADNIAAAAEGQAKCCNQNKYGDTVFHEILLSGNRDPHSLMKQAICQSKAGGKHFELGKLTRIFLHIVSAFGTM